MYLAAVSMNGIGYVIHNDGLLYRVELDYLDSAIMNYRGDSGFFYEYHASDISVIRPFCDNDRIQTIALLGNKCLIKPLFDSGVRGIDRVVPFGHTMDFDMVWDGLNLVEHLTRSIWQ